MTETIVGIDIGTTLTKGILYDADGCVIATASTGTSLLTPLPGRVEMEMTTLWNAVVETIRKLNDQPIKPHKVRCIGVSAMMGGLWILDKDNQPIRNAILWNDSRAVDILKELRDEGLVSSSFAVSGNMPTPGFTLVLLRWLRDHEPETLSKARTLFFAKDWIRYKLTGELATDESDASHAPGDVFTRSFSTTVIDDWGLSNFKGLLPPLLESGDIVGELTVEAAEATGLPISVSVITGLADVSASLLGAGAVHEGQAATILGSSCLNSVVTRSPVLPPSGIGLSFLLPGNLWTRTMPNQTGTLAFEWFKREFAPNVTDRWADSAVNYVPRGSRGLIFHPYMNGTGLLAPVYEPKARGRLCGLSLEHTRWDILRSIYEGIAYSIADCYELLVFDNHPIILLGGGAKSRIWSQIIADVTGREFQTMRIEEPGALGVCLLAGVSLGWWGTLCEAVTFCCRRAEMKVPDSVAHGEYSERLQIYKHLREEIVAE